MTSEVQHQKVIVKWGQNTAQAEQVAFLAGSVMRKPSVPCLVNYHMLMIKLLTQLDHSDWKKVQLEELQIHINQK